MQPGTVKLRKAHLPSEQQRSTRVVWRQNARSSSVSGNIRAASQQLGTGKKKNNSSAEIPRKALQLWEAHGQKSSVKSTRRWREKRCLMHRHSPGHFRAPHPCCKKSPLHLGSVGKDQLRTPVPSDEWAIQEDSHWMLSAAIYQKWECKLKQSHGSIHVHFMCEQQLPSWFCGIMKKAQGIADYK